MTTAGEEKRKRKIAFGDFQTPAELAREACTLLKSLRLQPQSIVEPTCGVGGFLVAAMEEFDQARKAVALEIVPGYVERARTAVHERGLDDRVRFLPADFFAVRWPEILQGLSEPLLVIGNPPWVTNAALGTLGSSNLPSKSNFKGHAGLDAITGKANFDISEWMLIHLLEWLHGRNATLAMLCKTAVARKVLHHAWKNEISLIGADLFPIDAQQHFGAAVDACFLVCRLSPGGVSRDCAVHRGLQAGPAVTTMGCRGGRLIADLLRYERWKHLAASGCDERFRWRSGVKHDCARIMELRKVGDTYFNGLGNGVSVEEDVVFPLLKSSDLANGAGSAVRRFMLVTQQSVAEDTGRLARVAPQAWRYLIEHGSALDRRASSIYRNRPRFAMFGVGPYSFAPWKVAISGLYKKLVFKVLGPVQGRPIVLDDTAYFLPCESEAEASILAAILNSDTAREFFEAFVFWDAKRPITVELLSRLDLRALALELGVESEMSVCFDHANARRAAPAHAEGCLFLTEANPD